MTPEQKLILRNNILLQLEAISPISAPTTMLRQGIQLIGFRNIDDEDIDRELQYLLDKNFIVESTSPLSAGLKRYRIGSGGLEYLESEQLT